MTDFLEEKRREIQARMEELRPAVEEYHRLEAAERALAGVPSEGGGRSGAGPARPRPRRNGSSGDTDGEGSGRRGRPKGSGQRAQQALEQIRGQPGITIPELADAMGIKQNYLYRVVPDLQEQGLVVKSGRGWHVRQ